MYKYWTDGPPMVNPLTTMLIPNHPTLKMVLFCFIIIIILEFSLLTLVLVLPLALLYVTNNHSEFVVIHNGIITNYKELSKFLVISNTIFYFIFIFESFFASH